MLPISCPLLMAALATGVLAAQQDIVMWPWMNPDSMSASLDVDSTCLNALIEKEDWQGQQPAYDADDYCTYGGPSLDMPKCADPDFDLSVVPPSTNSMVRLYSTDLVWIILTLITTAAAACPPLTCITPQLCSNWFPQYFHGRLASPFLTEGGDTDYLLDQWTDIQSACGKDMPAITASKTLYFDEWSRYATATPTILTARKRKAKREATPNV
ncbi:hypothetical protein N657DRAFT_687452 [Parathielavia appendiculata]|uniref:Uncharacterized protein n=1 Tax=Parathielavia appendiculata TaxID=2587402 RepID=A0AAN6U661_9PEZI|nr:hypothetical protein N657DRAFT_687452 [Parathielavia appendiculata]